MRHARSRSIEWVCSERPCWQAVGEILQLPLSEAAAAADTWRERPEETAPNTEDTSSVPPSESTSPPAPSTATELVTAASSTADGGGVDSVTSATERQGASAQVRTVTSPVSTVPHMIHLNMINLVSECTEGI